jgi:cholesterol oxidase
MTLLHTYIPAAIQLGAEFRTGCAVETLEPSGTGYIVNYVRDGAVQQLFGQKVIVAGGGIHTPALLLRSRAKLPKLSAQVGENFNTNGEHVYMAILPEGYAGTEDFDVWKGMDNAGLMSFHFWESNKLTLHPGGGFEPSILGANLAKADHPVLPRRAFGLAYKRFAEAIYRRRLVAFSALGLSPSHFAIGLKADGSADVVLRDRTGHDAYLARLEACVQSLAEANGATVIDAVDKRYSGMTSAHLLAGCRMANTKEEGVVDADGRVFGYENLYICDASTVPYALGVNPALTISAIAERASARIVQRG